MIIASHINTGLLKKKNHFDKYNFKGTLIGFSFIYKYFQRYVQKTQLLTCILWPWKQKKKLKYGGKKEVSKY